jgi:hypothetical protein
MAKKRKGIFEADRRMELRLRLAAKKAVEPAFAGGSRCLSIDAPEKIVLDRIINRVRKL